MKKKIETTTKIQIPTETNRFDERKFLNVASGTLKFSLNIFEVVKEIQERKDFLSEMEKIGEGDKYRLIIEQQIQARVREMERLKIK